MQVVGAAATLLLIPINYLGLLRSQSRAFEPAREAMTHCGMSHLPNPNRTLAGRMVDFTCVVFPMAST